MDPNLVGTMDGRADAVIKAEIKAKNEEAERKKFANRKRRAKMRGRNVAGKDKLVRNTRREQMKRDLIRSSNMKRLKARLAEKVKNRRELDELNDGLADFSAITNELKSKSTRLDDDSD